MTKITQEHISKALTVSKKSPMNKKFGALLIHKGKVVSIGYNYYDNVYKGDNTQCLL